MQALDSVVIAFSGGVDSALVAKAASKALPKTKVLLVTADSQSLGSGELEKCKELSQQWNLEWMVDTDSPKYLMANRPLHYLRCSHVHQGRKDHFPCLGDKSARVHQARFRKLFERSHQLNQLVSHIHPQTESAMSCR